MSTIKVYRDDEQWTWYMANDDNRRGRDCYETNQVGEGIFQVNEDTLERTQLTGTCQFSLRGCSQSAAYHRIKRWFEME